MPTKEKKYKHVIFPPEVIKESEETILTLMSGNDKSITFSILRIRLSSGEEWVHDNEEEFFADYRRGFLQVSFLREYRSNKINGKIYIWINENDTQVTVSMPGRSEVEKAFNVFEKNVDRCRLPKQPKEKSNVETDWITENVNKIEAHCPVVARKVKLALLKLDSEEAEEWQNATMLIRDAWIELSQWLCLVKDIDTSDIPSDSVIDRLKKLNMDKIDERLFNLARASFNLYSKHHKRDIGIDAAVACVISTIVSMKTVIVEVLNA